MNTKRWEEGGGRIKNNFFFKKRKINFKIMLVKVDILLMINK